MKTWSSIFVLQHRGCLHNVPVYRLVLTARRIMARRTSFSCVEWRNEAFVLNTWRPLFHLNPQESANIPKHVSPDGILGPLTRTQQTLLHTFLFVRHGCPPLRSRQSCLCLLVLCTFARRALQPKDKEENRF